MLICTRKFPFRAPFVVFIQFSTFANRSVLGFVISAQFDTCNGAKIALESSALLDLQGEALNKMVAKIVFLSRKLLQLSVCDTRLMITQRI